MFAAGMVPVNDGLVVVVGLACFDVLVDGGIGDPHVLLIGLALVKAGRGALVIMDWGAFRYRRNSKISVAVRSAMGLRS